MSVLHPLGDTPLERGAADFGLIAGGHRQQRNGELIQLVREREWNWVVVIHRCARVLPHVEGLAERDISAVSFRDIAAAAGVSHGLVQQYFGTREHMIAAIIQHEIEEVERLLRSGQSGKTGVTSEDIRSLLKAGEARFRDYARLITRAELAGVEPEKMLDPATPTPAMALADSIRELQTKSPKSSARMDPRLVSAYINASVFAFATMSPWLMKSVGLEAKDYEARLDEISDISVKLISLAAGMI